MDNVDPPEEDEVLDNQDELNHEEEEEEMEDGEEEAVWVVVPQQTVKVETEEERAKREEQEKIKRAKIFEIQRNTNLTDREKSIAIKNVISGKNFTEKTNENKECIEASYQDEEKTILGCKHYRRNCKILSKCCDQWFVCRLCHNEVKNHEIDRKATTTMVCMLCKLIQPVSQVCSGCHTKISDYYCSICKLFDSTPGKDIYHCYECGICRVGKSDDYIHCPNCAGCFNKEGHKCGKLNLHTNCPFCMEDLFTSVEPSFFMKCGHSVHSRCVSEYLSTQPNNLIGIHKCPLCNKAIVPDRLQIVTQFVDQLILQQPMPEQYKKRVTISCFECNNQSPGIEYHFVGNKCAHCNTYNTVVVGGDPNFEEEKKQKENKEPET